MAVEPTGPRGVPLQRMKNMLANSAAWQTWCGAANATEALENIFFGTIPSGDLVNPAALIDYGGHDAGATRDGVNYARQQAVYLSVWAVVSTSVSDSDAATTFMNLFGPVFEQLLANANASTGVPVLEYEVLNGPVVTPKEQAGASGGRDVFIEYILLTGMRQ